MNIERVVLRAPAKINWTLEILGKRADSYHEVRTVLQTVNLCDTVTLIRADNLTLSVRGSTRRFRKQSRDAPESNLAYRAARLLQERSTCGRGVSIRLDKHIPLAAGLGGGSSDAAAVLRGLRRLWHLDISDDALSSVAAELGSDVPFFLRGGAALASGRGDVFEALPDILNQPIAITTRRQQPADDKTAQMYAAISPEHYTDGSRTEALAARIRAGEPVREEDIYNVFEAVLPAAAPTIAAAMLRAREQYLGSPHLCGSGPALFFFADSFRVEPGAADVYHNAFTPVQLVTAAEATAMSVDA